MNCLNCHKETQVYRGRPRQYCIDCIESHTKIFHSKWYRMKTLKKIQETTIQIASLKEKEILLLFFSYILMQYLICLFQLWH